MSLVEKALKKIRDTQGGPNRSAESPHILVGSVVEAPADDEGASPRPSKKCINVDDGALRSAGLMPPAEAQRQLISEYRQIKRPLLAAALGKGMVPLRNGRTIMVASSLPGEGKTFVSINLALSLALEKDISIVLVDADLAKPHISRTFGVEGEPGLIEALLDRQIDIESLIIPTNIAGLSILPAGRMIETATELLASARMEQLVARMSTVDPKRVVLFDSPPLLLTSESRVLASVSGQVVVVVCAGRTPRSAVNEALQHLGEREGLSMILNQSETVTPADYYGYGEYGAAPQ